MLTHRLRGNRDDLTALHWSNLLVVEQGFSSAPPIHKIKTPRWGVFILWRMGRDSNPRWSCPHNGFQDRRNRPLCHPSAAHHSFALDCADACLADSYARPSQSTAATTHPELHHTAGLSNLRRGLKTLAIIQCLERIVNLSVMLIIILANPDARVIIITGEAT